MSPKHNHKGNQAPAKKPFSGFHNTVTHSGPPMVPVILPPKDEQPPVEKAQRYTSHMKIFTKTDTLELNSTISRTKEEIDDVLIGIRTDGMVFRSEDGQKITTYMPNSILKVVTTLTPVEESGEDK